MADQEHLSEEGLFKNGLESEQSATGGAEGQASQPRECQPVTAVVRWQGGECAVRAERPVQL